MPKQKTRSTAKKRFTLKKSGVIKRSKQNRRHILTHKSQDRKRGLRKGTYVSKSESKTIKGMIINN